jgi:isoleucyl-tRNA synthetase
MDLVRVLVGLGRGAREKERIKVRQPLPAVIVDGEYEPLIGDMTGLIKEELNIKEVVFTNDTTKYFDMSVKPDFRVAGKALGANMKAFAASLARAGSAALIAALDNAGESGVVWSLTDAAVRAGRTEPASGDEVVIEKDYITVQIDAKEGFAVAIEKDVFAILDTTLTDELVREGIAREFISKIQQIRKQINLEMMDRVRVAYDGDAEVSAVAHAYGEYIKKETLAEVLVAEKDGAAQTYDLNGHETAIRVEKV